MAEAGGPEAGVAVPVRTEAAVHALDGPGVPALADGPASLVAVVLRLLMDSGLKFNR